MIRNQRNEPSGLALTAEPESHETNPANHSSGGDSIPAERTHGRTGRDRPFTTSDPRSLPVLLIVPYTESGEKLWGRRGEAR